MNPRILSLLLLLALLLLTSPARATTTTLVITSGGGFFDCAGENGVSIGGNDFFALYRSLNGSCFGSLSGPFQIFVPFADSGFGTNSGFVTVHNDICSYGPSPFGGVNFCGSLIITTTEGLGPRPDDPTTPVVPVPFTATGHLNVGPGYDVVGQGEVFWKWNCLGPCGGFVANLGLTFTAPEPSTLMLLVSGLALMVCAWFIHTRRRVWFRRIG